MSAKQRISKKAFFRAGVGAAFMALVVLLAGPTEAQQVAVDVQVGAGDRVYTQGATSIEAEAGQTIVVEVFGTGFSGIGGVQVTLIADSLEGLVDANADGNPDVTLAGGSIYPMPLSQINGTTLTSNLAVLGTPPTESGTDLKFFGSFSMVLSPSFTILNLTLSEVKFGIGGAILTPGTVLTIANPGSLPKTFQADLNQKAGNQGVLSGKANPGGRFQVQTFVGGLKDVDEVEIKVEVDPTQIRGEETGFIPASGFSLVPVSGGGLGSTAPSGFANVEVDIQNVPDGKHTPTSLSVTAGGGSTVSLEIFGSGYEGANGVKAKVRVSDPTAIKSMSGTGSTSFNIVLPGEASIDGNIITLQLGNLFAPSSAPFQVVGTLNLELAPNYNGLKLEVINVDFPPSSVSGTPNAVLTVTPTGGLRPSLVQVSGNNVVLRLKAAVPVSGDVALGKFVFATTPSFAQTTLTFRQVTFITGEIPTGIEPNVAIAMRSNLSNAPTVSEPPGLVTISDSRALIRWVTNREGTGRLIYGTNPGNLDQEAIDSGSRRIHQVELTGLDLGKRYFYQVITTDPAGNQSDAFPTRPLFFVTKRRPDTQPPRVVRGPSAVGITTDAVRILIETDEASTIEILYGTAVDALSQTASSTGESKLHELTLTGLTAGGTYFFKARATDQIGNVAETPQARQFKLRSVADASAPRIVGRPTILGATFNAAVIRWLTTEPSSSVARFGLTDALGDTTSSDELVNQHTLSISNLLSDTTYFYQVASVDASGNPVTSPTFTFRTRSGEDTTPPRITRPPVVARRSDTEALIVFRTNEPSTASIQVDSDLAVASDTTGVLGDTFTTSNATKSQGVLLTNLDPATVYFYRIAVTDLTGNGPTYNIGQLSFATLSVADTASPIVFSKPVALGITEDGATINWAADEPHTAIIRYRGDLDGDGNLDVGTFDEFVEDLELSRRHAVPIAGLRPGCYYEYDVETVDSEGNSSTISGLSFTTRMGADTAAPTIVKGPRVTNITASSATVEWGTDEPADTRVHWGSTVQYTETIELAESARFHTTTLTDLEAGTIYHYAVGSADGSGNIVTTDANGTTTGLSEDHTFRTRSTEDANPPIITEGPLAEIRNNLVILKWRTDEQATSRVTVGVLAGSADAAVEGASVFGEASQIVFDENFLTRRHVVTVTGLSPGLNYRFQVSSTDAAGNTATSVNPSGGSKFQPPGGFGSFTTTLVADTQFPVITSGPTVVASTSSSVTVEWATDESSNGTVDFGASDANLDNQEVTGTNETTHRLVLTKLATGTNYAYQIGSTDASGNGATKSAVVFASTQAGEDLTAPILSTTPSVIYVNDRQATVSWGTNEAADSEIAFGTSATELLEVRSESDFNTSHSITLTNLVAGTTYFYKVNSSDQNNNGPATSSVLEFATDASPDLVAPSITGDVSVAVTDEQALITWATDELSDSSVRFGLTSGSLDFNTGESEDVTSHSISLTNLQPATTYTYQVESIDKAGNGPTKGSELTFTTLAAGETAVLAAPSGVVATAGNGAVKLIWTYASTSGVTGFVVERDAGTGTFQSIASVQSTGDYTDSNVENGTSYTYRIRTLGLAQAQSDPSTATDAVTPADGIGPSTPVLKLKQGNPLQPTFVVENSTPLNAGDVLNYTFQLSSMSDFSDAIALDSGLGEGAGLGSSDPSGLTAWTVTRALDDGATYHYRIKASDGTFDSVFLTGQFTVSGSDLAFPGDIDGDFNVGFGDFLTLVGTFGKASSDGEFVVGADFNTDGAVDFTDFLTFVGAFGTQFIRGEEASAKPLVVALTYGIDGQTKLNLVGRPTSSKAGGELIVEIHAKDAVDLMGAGLRIDYNTDALEFVEAFQGIDALFNSDERKAEMFATLEHDPAKGNLFVAGAITEGDAVAGEGVVSRLRFVLKTDHPQGDLLSIAEGLLIDGNLNVNGAQNIGARLTLVPETFALDHNFPNPFNPETTIRYAIPEASQVRLIVYNVLGQEVTRLVDKDQVPGFYTLRWDGKDTFGRGVASGVYLYKIQATGETQRFSQIHKMLLLK